MSKENLLTVEKVEVIPINERSRYGSRRGSQKVRLFISPVGESVMEQFVAGRRTRPYTAYRKLLPEIFEKAGIPADTKASWSQKAGCSCPCSPGFVLDYYSHINIWASVGGPRGYDTEEVQEYLGKKD